VATSNLKYCSISFLVVVLPLLAGGEIAVGDDAFKVQAVLKVNRQPAWLLRNNSEVEFREFVKNQSELIKLPYVLAATVADRDVAGLELVKGQADPDKWLKESLAVENPDGTSLLVLTLSGPGDSKQLRTALDALVDAYMAEVVAVERISEVEMLRNLKVHQEELQDKYKELIKRRMAIVEDAKVTQAAAEMKLLDLKIDTYEVVLKDLERTVLQQEMLGVISDAPVKLMQQAMIIQGQ
jgi:hypothetical protein